MRLVYEEVKAPSSSSLGDRQILPPTDSALLELGWVAGAFGVLPGVIWLTWSWLFSYLPGSMGCLGTIDQCAGALSAPPLNPLVADLSHLDQPIGIFVGFVWLIPIAGYYLRKLALARSNFRAQTSDQS